MADVDQLACFLGAVSECEEPISHETATRWAEVWMEVTADGEA